MNLAVVARQNHEPPNNIEAEWGLLGAILEDNRTYDTVCEIVTADHFYDDWNAKVYSAIAGLIAMNRVANPVTLKGVLPSNVWNGMGGDEFISSLVTYSFAAVNARSYAETVRELADRRAIIREAQDLIDGLYGAEVDQEARKMAEEATDRLDAIVGASIDIRPTMSIADAMRASNAETRRAMDTEGEVSGVSTGIRYLDHLLGGLHPQDLIVLAGATSMGKTALAMSIGHSAARSGKHAAMFSLEMSAAQLGSRLLAMESGIGSDKQRRGDLTEEEYQALRDAEKRAAGLPLLIDDNSSATLPFIKQRCRRAKARAGLDLVIIDYLQLMTPLGNFGSRAEAVSSLTRGLKVMASELEVPIILLSQMNRTIASRDDKRPLLSDLKESGSIEQDADSVLFCYREEYYLERDKPEKKVGESNDKFIGRMADWQARLSVVRNKGDIIVAKNRLGPAPRTVSVAFDPDRTLYHDINSGRADEPPPHTEIPEF